MKFRKLLVWMLMLAMILNLPASTLADRLPVCTNHVWSEWDPIEQPTCTSPGHQVRFCQVCHTQQTGRHQRADLHFHRLPFSYLHGLRNPGDRNHGQSAA